MDIFNSSNREYDTIYNNKKKERKKMVGFKYNRWMERHDIELPYKLGDLKDLVCVASIDDEKVDDHNVLGSTITFWKPLDMADVRSILLQYEELKYQLGRNPLDDVDLGKESHFEPDPDGKEGK